MTARVKYLGIDSGRTAIKLAFRDETGHIQRKHLPAHRFTVNWFDNINVVRTLERWCEEANCYLTEGSRVVLGAAGAAEYERIWYEKVTLSGAGPQTTRIELLGDISLAALACHIEETGIVIVYGTGGALMACEHGNRHIFNSYGPVVGDLWGGLALGRQAVRHLLDRWDRTESSSEFESILATALGIGDRKEYLDWVHTAEYPYGDLAKLGQKTVEYAVEGHRSARELCERTLESIVSVIGEVKQYFTLPAPIPTVLQGSLLEKSPWMRSRLCQLLEQKETQCQFLLPQEPLEVYALKRAESLE